MKPRLLLILLALSLGCNTVQLLWPHKAKIKARVNQALAIAPPRQDAISLEDEDEGGGILGLFLGGFDDEVETPPVPGQPAQVLVEYQPPPQPPSVPEMVDYYLPPLSPTQPHTAVPAGPPPVQPVLTTNQLRDKYKGKTIRTLLRHGNNPLVQEAAKVILPQLMPKMADNESINALKASMVPMRQP